MAASKVDSHLVDTPKVLGTGALAERYIMVMLALRKLSTAKLCVSNALCPGVEFSRLSTGSEKTADDLS